MPGLFLSSEASGFPLRASRATADGAAAGYTNFISLLVGAVHFFLQFLQKLRALLGA
jgi:hypothetical protein